MTEMTKIAGVETPIEVARLINALVDNKGNIDLDNLSETGLAKFTNLDTKITNVQENVNALTTTVNEKIGATVSKAQNGYIKFTNGVIIQWVFVDASSDINQITINWPVAMTSVFCASAQQTGGPNTICGAELMNIKNASFYIKSAVKWFGSMVIAIGYYY